MTWAGLGNNSRYWEAEGMAVESTAVYRVLVTKADMGSNQHGETVLETEEVKTGNAEVHKEIEESLA